MNAPEPAADASNETDGPVVLLVDDQPIIGKSEQHMLRAEKDITFHFCQKGAEALAEQLRGSCPGMTNGWILHLQLASSIHDIGKVGIPDSVLLKPGKLTAEERAVIERHPMIGADALDAILARDAAAVGVTG